MFSPDALQQIMPRAPRPWLVVMVEELPKAGIDTINEIASFVAQLAHESNDLTHLEENLHYSAVRLAQVWRRFAMNPDAPSADRIPNDLAYKLQKNPEALANYIYDDANRSPRASLGNIYPGDGWRFHGRGPIQLTGRRNYTNCGLWLGEDLIRHPDLLLTPYTGIRSAIWFWRANHLDALDDDDDARLETRRINGGETGLAHRQAIFDRAVTILEAA